VEQAITPVTSTKTVLYGDINQDGKFDMLDLNYLSDVLVKKIDSPKKDSAAFRAGDVNGDLKLDAADKALFSDRLLGKIKKFPVEIPVKTNLEKLKCLELVKGMNNLNENRLNIVFVGINKDINTLVNNSLMAADYDAVGKGLLAIEPFKSNRDKFNFFYINETAYVDPNTVNSFGGGAEITNEISRLTSSCSLNNQYTIVFTNFTMISTGGEIIKINALGGPGTVIHEFGHSFGQLQDERNGRIYTGPLGVQYTNCYYPRYLNCTSRLKCTPEKGCWNATPVCSSTPESIADCEANVDWKDLIGNGCGKDGIIDCPKDFIPTAQEICTYDEYGVYSCTNLTATLSNPEANVEVSCDNVGCLDLNNMYRPAYNDIMVSSTSYFSFNPVNERYLCRRIKNLTGSVGGICDKLCLNGCPDGERCIEGVCN
jgi:hypothetical protein